VAPLFIISAYIRHDRKLPALYTHGDSSNSDDSAGDSSQTDEAESTDDDNDEPVLDGEVLQGEVVRLKQELSDVRDRLNEAKTDLAFQQSRRPIDYDNAYFIEELDELRSQIRGWCMSYFTTTRSYWTVPAERKFKLLSKEWAAYMSNKARRPWLIQAYVWYALDQYLFDPVSKKRASWLFTGRQTGQSIDRMFAQGESSRAVLSTGLLIITGSQLSSHANRQVYLEWRALTFTLLFPGKGHDIEPTLSMKSDFDARVKKIFNEIWTSLREYTHRKPSREEIIEAKGFP
jgi:hypothetical protein